MLINRREHLILSAIAFADRRYMHPMNPDNPGRRDGADPIRSDGD